MGRFDIKLTQAAKEAALDLASQNKAIRFTVTRSGCCSMAASIYPDAERVGDLILEADGVRILTRDEYPELTWIGTIDYKSRGLHRGFIWRPSRA